MANIKMSTNAHCEYRKGEYLVTVGKNENFCCSHDRNQCEEAPNAKRGLLYGPAI